MFSKSRLGLFGLIMLMLIGSLSALAGGAAAQDESPPTPGCPAGQGYWKQTATWPVTDLTLGSQSYTQAEVLILLNSPVGGDASLNLADQLAAAKLNVANGADATLAAGVITQADMLLSNYPDKLPYNVDPSSGDGQTMVNLSGVLESYNGGQLSLGCLPEVTPEATVEATLEVTPEATTEPDEDLPVTIVIEGPVDAININIITIYNINIQLNPDDPNLNIIQVGDIVHVDGDTEQSGNTIIIIAINIVIVNVDINTDNGQVYRDDGANCSNPPPPWAPAHGWHRRCDQQTNNGDININININGGNGNGKGMGMGDD
jgi:hypothetical protein